MTRAIQLKVVGDKVQVTKNQHGHCIVRIPDPSAQPFRAGCKRDMAWQVIKTMDGKTVLEVAARLEEFERQIKETGRPLGWLADTLARKAAELFPPSDLQ